MENWFIIEGIVTFTISICTLWKNYLDPLILLLIA